MYLYGREPIDFAVLMIKNYNLFYFLYSGFMFIKLVRENRKQQQQQQQLHW